MHTCMHTPLPTQELPDALPTLDDFEKGQKHEGPMSHWIRTPQARLLHSPQDDPIFSMLVPTAQASLQATLAKMQRKSKKCQYLQGLHVGLHAPTIKKALAAFRSGRAVVELSDGRISGTLGVSEDCLSAISDATGWATDLVSIHVCLDSIRV